MKKAGSLLLFLASSTLVPCFAYGEPPGKPAEPDRPTAAGRDGAVEFAIVGADQRPLPCRIHVKDQRANPCYPPQLPRWADHFVCAGRAELRLPANDYTFEIERGPEYARESGTFRLRAARGNASNGG